jgi:hypothetical protein
MQNKEEVESAPTSPAHSNELPGRLPSNIKHMSYSKLLGQKKSSILKHLEEYALPTNPQEERNQGDCSFSRSLSTEAAASRDATLSTNIGNCGEYTCQI